MKKFLMPFLWFFGAVTVSSYCLAFISDSEDIQKFVLEQPLDHFQKASNTYKQHLEVWIPSQTRIDAPILFFPGSEAGRGNLKDLAKPYLAIGYKAIFAQADHRGYGSYSDDEDQTIPAYVTSDQAVEDFHQDLIFLNTKFPGPVAIVGFSYSGTIAIKLAAKYPKDVRAVVASSGAVEI
jgi:pimeloyl-ACP methyl ester carboxylesterase